MEPVGPWSYEQQQLGFNYRLTDLQAALGLSQLKRLDEIVAIRNRLYQRYEALLKGLPVQLLQIPAECHSALHLAVIRLRVIAQHVTVQCLKASGRQALVCSCITRLFTYSLITVGWVSVSDFPHAELCASAISLPLFPGLTSEDQGRLRLWGADATARSRYSQFGMRYGITNAEGVPCPGVHSLEAGK